MSGPNRQVLIRPHRYCIFPHFSPTSYSREGHTNACVSFLEHMKAGFSLVRPFSEKLWQKIATDRDLELNPEAGSLSEDGSPVG